jgi:hypothetical protein
MLLNVQVKMLYKQYQVSVKKLNIIEPLMKCRNGSSSCKSQSFLDGCDNCNGKLLTGYRLTGIKAAGALHRLLFGT